MDKNYNKFKMKLLYLSNNPDYNYLRSPRGDFALLHFFKKKGHDVLALTKKEMWKFFFVYKNFKPDIIISAFVPSGFIPAFFNKVGLIKCPVIHWWDDFYTMSITTYPFFLVDFLEKFTIKNSDYITTISKYNQNRATAMLKPVYYIPNGVVSNRKKTKINLNSLKTNPKNLKLVYTGGQHHK
ncbi:MAG: hypothetical protein AABY22_32225, partial [Nanoarchaeota archaeon]